MTSEEYGQYIDDFELDVDVMPGESLTEYIERRRREFDSKADGGMIGIEVLFGPKRDEFSIGGRARPINRVYDSRATAQDFAKALGSVSAGTTYQQQADAKRYARQQANEMLRSAMKSADPSKGPGLQGIYDTFFKGKNTGISPTTFSPGGSGRMISYSSRDRDRMLDAMANQMLSTTSYAAPKPRPKTYRTVSPEAQALNMSQATYEDIIRSGADPQKYYMDYQNRIMAGNPNPLKYGQVIGGPGGPGLMGGATPPTQAQINQMMQSNPMGYVDFADLVKTYSADPYKGLKEEIKDMVDGRDTGYMSAQDYYDVNVLGLTGKEIAEKYGLQYADGGRVPMVSGGFLKGIGKGIMELLESGANKKMFRSKDDIPLSTYSEMKGPIKLSDMENIPEDQLKKILRTQELGLYEETPELLKAANLLARFTKKVKGKRVIDYERAEDILGVKLKGNETLDDLFKIEFETRPVETMADGGRVGLFMGGPALEGQALQIYNSMKGYNFSDQEIADALSARGLYTPAGSGTTTQPEQVTGIIGAQIGRDRDDGPQGDFGDFGNLLKDTEKTFIKDVYTEIAPGKFDFVPTEVIGYQNVKTGNYQTKEGKNIDHLGIEVPTIAGMLFDKNFGKGPQPGDIKGTFTDGIPPGMKNFFSNPFGLFKKQQATIADINAMNKKAVDDMKAKQAAEEAAARRELENRIISGGAVIQGSGDDGRGNITTSAGTFAPGDYSDVAGTLADPREKMDFYKDGGLATMFTRRR